MKIGDLMSYPLLDEIDLFDKIKEEDFQYYFRKSSGYLQTKVEDGNQI